MGKKNLWNGFMLLLATMAVLTLAGCPQEVEETVFSDDASLVSIALNDVEGTIPPAVLQEDWNDPSFDISSMPYGHFTYDNAANLEEVTISATTTHQGAKIQYGQGTNSEAPVIWNKTGRFYSLSKENTLYITVMSESGKIRNFYKVRLALQSEGTIADLTRFEVNGSAARIANPNADIAQVVPGTLWVDSVLSAPAQITAIPANENATVTTALVKRGNGYENAMFYEASSYEMDEGDVLWVKCVSFDETVTQYYAATIRIYNHITLTISGKTVEVIGQGGADSGTVNFGDVALTSAEAAIDAVIKASPIASTGAAVTGYQISSGAPSATAWVDPDSNGAYVRTAAIPNANYLAVRVEDKFQQIYYYRVYIRVQNSSAALGVISVGGVNASLGTPQSAPWAGTENTGTVIVPPGQASPNQTNIVVTGTGSGTTVNGATGSWAKAANATAIPADADFNTNPIAGGLAKDQYLFVKAVSQDGSATQYYKILVSDVKNNDVSLTSVTIGSVAVSNIGTGGTAVNVAATFRGAIAINPALAAQTGLAVKAMPTAGSNATITGYAIVASTQNNPTFSTPGSDGAFTTTAAITNGQHLFVRVEAETGTLYYYRIVITVLSSNADITAITVGGLAATLGTPQNALWAGTDNTGTVIIPTREASPTATSVAVTGSTGVVASWAKAANASAIPADGDFRIGSVAGGLAKDQYLFVKAVSSDGTVSQYYKILVSDVKSDVIALSSVTVGGVTATLGGTNGAGGTAVNVAANARGAVAIPSAGAAIGARIVATPLAGSNAAITGYAVVASNQNNPTFVTPSSDGTFTTTAAIATTNHLFVRVEAEIGALYYYRIVITVQSNVATLTAITVGGVAASALGTPQNAPWAGTDNTGTATIPISAAAPNNTSIATTATQTNAVRTWAVAANATTIPADSAFSGTTPITGGVTVGNYIFVKSVSQDSSTTLYYKILVSDVKSNVVSLSGVTIGSVAAGTIGTGGTAVNVGTGAGLRGAITISGTQAGQTGLTVKATPTTGSNATITGYAVATSNTTNPTFIAPDASGEFTTTAVIANTNHLFVRVQAEIGTLYYYRIVITVQD
ncbi:MAG: hypothetical protein LBK02_01400 [Treponema sp.]|jgi:hypothetical protein|nr:hypothetical protein [Treponema sp.]